MTDIIAKSPKLSQAILQSLEAGFVSRVGLAIIAFGREAEMAARARDYIDINGAIASMRRL